MPTLPGSRSSSGRTELVSVSWMRIARGTSRKLADPLDRGGRHTGDSFAAAHEAESFVRPELDADLTAVETGGCGQLLAHPVAVGTQSRRLAHDRGVDRADRVATLGELVADDGQQLDTARILPLRLGVREVVADVSERGGAEQRVHDRVRDDVGVRVAGQPSVRQDGHATEHQLAAFLETVDVEADPGAE